MNKTSQPAVNYLETATHDLKFIFNKIKAIQLIQQKVSSYLDPVLAKHCQVANIAENKLILLAANGSVATQVRYSTNEILNKFRQDPALQHIKHIECKVRPAVPAKTTDNNKAYQIAPLSQDTAVIVRELAETIEDKKLRDIMLRIAEHTE